MKKLFILLLALALVTSCYSTNKISHNAAKKLYGQKFDEKKVHIVDHVGNNWLFRGNMPIEGKDLDRKFAYKKLVNTFDKKIKHEYSIGLPKDFYFVNISLLNSTEFLDLELERKFFVTNSKNNRFINWPLLGFDNISIHDERLKKFQFEASKEDLDKQYKHIQKLNSILSKTYDKPLVVYIHCNAGCNRTGRFIAAYRMTLKGYKLKESKTKNTSECGQSSNQYSMKSTELYCKYLKTLKMYNATCSSK